MYHYYFLKTVIYWQLICRICRGSVHSLDIRLWRWMEIDIWSCGDLSYRNCAQDIGVIFHIFIDQHFSTLTKKIPCYKVKWWKKFTQNINKTLLHVISRHRCEVNGISSEVNSHDVSISKSIYYEIVEDTKILLLVKMLRCKFA